MSSNSNLNQQQGVALLSAMLMLLLLAAIAAVMSVHSQRLWFKSNQQTTSTTQMYQQEGAVARGLWLFLNDLTTHPTRANLDTIDYSTQERFVADGRIHYFVTASGNWYELKIVDYFSGIQPEIDFDETTFEFLKNRETTTEQLSRIETVEQRLLDYIDSDTIARMRSLENREYRQLKKELLPRNAPPQFPEEYGWISGALEVFPPDEYGRQNWIQPSGLPENKPNIFAAPRELVYLLTNADSTQRQHIDDAFQALIEDQYTLKFSLELIDNNLYSSIEQNFSLEESGYYVIIVRPMLESGRRGRAFELVIQLLEPPASFRINLISLRII